MVFVAKTALPSCVVVKVYRKAFTTNGRRTSWRQVNVGWQVIRRVQPQPTKSKTCVVKPEI